MAQKHPPQKQSNQQVKNDQSQPKEVKPPPLSLEELEAKVEKLISIVDTNASILNDVQEWRNTVIETHANLYQMFSILDLVVGDLCRSSVYHSEEFRPKLCPTMTDDQKEMLAINYAYYMSLFAQTGVGTEEEATKDYPIMPTEPQEQKGEYPEGAFVFGGDYGKNTTGA